MQVLTIRNILDKEAIKPGQIFTNKAAIDLHRKPWYVIIIPERKESEVIPLNATDTKAKATKSAPEKVQMTGITPTDLAETLDISPKSLRAWLRTNYPRTADQKNSRWYLPESQVKAATEHYTKPKKAE